MKLPKVTFTDPVQRLTLGLKDSTLKELAQYQAYYKETYGDDIDRTQLIEEMLRSLMREDKAFQRFAQQKGKGD